MSARLNLSGAHGGRLVTGRFSPHGLETGPEAAATTRPFSSGGQVCCHFRAAGLLGVDAFQTSVADLLNRNFHLSNTNANKSLAARKGSQRSKS